MVKLPRFGRLRLPQRLTQRWRAGLSAQRRWWRARRRARAAAAGGAVLFPAAGHGAIPVEALSPRRGGGRLRVPLYCVITDFAAHPFWAFPHVDRYFVASAEVAGELAGHGVAADRIEVTGIPVDPKFARTMGREAARDRLGLDRA